MHTSTYIRHPLARRARIDFLAYLLVAGPGCFVSTATDPERVVGTTTSDASDYDAWRATLEQDDRGAYIVEGDLPIWSEAELAAYYRETYVSPTGLTVLQVGAADNIWSLAAKNNLTYCVSTGFGAQQAQVVTAMANAAAAWETAAEVDFIYVSAQDASCNAANVNVVFNVRPGSCGATCNASSFWPSSPRNQRDLIVAGSAFTQPVRSLTGILTHELGHSLGFPHEHTWVGCNGEGQVGTGLTEYDNRSVMHYGWCSTSMDTGDYDLTTRDILGAGCLYNQSMPRSACGRARNSADKAWWSQGANRVFDKTESLQVSGLYHPAVGDFDGDGRDDIHWYRRGAGNDVIWWSNGDRSHASQAINVPGVWDPFVGDFDGNGRDDIFWYSSNDGASILNWGEGGRVFGSLAINAPANAMPLAGDFDGNGRTDILWYRPGNAADSIWWGQANRTFLLGVISVAGTYVPVVGNFDGQWGDDILWYALGDAADYLWWSDGDGTFTSENKAIGGSYSPKSGNFDAQLGDDILWHTGGAGADYIWYANGNRTFVSDTLAIDGHFAPLIGNLDGQNGDDIFWYAPLSAGYDVGILPAAGQTCPGEEIWIRMDDEDDNNQSATSGWIGQVAQGGSWTELLFCRVNGSDFGKLVGGRSSNYAVLQLGTACPPGAESFQRYFDNEDDNNNNQSSGELGPNVSNNNTRLFFCVFAATGNAGAANVMPTWPTVMQSYGVFADAPLPGAISTGAVYTDDEDSDNNNSYAGRNDLASDFVHGNANTTLETARVL